MTSQKPLNKEFMTFFKNHDGTEYFMYEALSGVLTMLVADGCLQGIYTRCDSASANLVRQFDRDMRLGVSEHIRLFHPCNNLEWGDKYAAVLDALNRRLTEVFEMNAIDFNNQ